MGAKIFSLNFNGLWICLKNRQLGEWAMNQGFLAPALPASTDLSTDSVETFALELAGARVQRASRITQNEP
jgi:hypothetical protein